MEQEFMSEIVIMKHPWCALLMQTKEQQSWLWELVEHIYKWVQLKYVIFLFNPYFGRVLSTYLKSNLIANSQPIFDPAKYFCFLDHGYIKRSFFIRDHTNKNINNVDRFTPSPATAHVIYVSMTRYDPLIVSSRLAKNFAH